MQNKAELALWVCATLHHTVNKTTGSETAMGEESRL